MMRCCHHVHTGGIVLALLVLSGCSSRTAKVAPRPTPAVDRNRDASGSTAGPAIAAPQPAETPRFWAAAPPDATPHFLTNASQHTFASVGRNFDPDLDPEGKWLVFASTHNSLRPDIFIKRVDGYALTQLTHDPADDVQPRFSPDGQRIVFASNRSGNWDLWMIALDGTGLVRLTDDPTHEIAPSWSPDGEQIAFTAWGRRSGQWEIWTIAVSRPSVRRFLTYGMFPDWSPDGKMLAFQRARQRGTRHFSIWTVELIDGEARNPTEVAYSDRWACITPRWGPGGRSLAYATVPIGRPDAGRAAAIWAVDMQTGLKSKLTNGDLPAFNPIWSADGRVFFVGALPHTENIWSVEPKLEALSQDATAGARQSASSLPRVNTPVSLKPAAQR